MSIYCIRLDYDFILINYFDVLALIGFVTKSPLKYLQEGEILFGLFLYLGEGVWFRDKFLFASFFSDWMSLDITCIVANS